MRTLLLSLLLVFGLSAQEVGFVPNAGQWEGEFDFRLRDPQGYVYLKAEEQKVALIQKRSVHNQHHHHHQHPWKAHVYTIKWLGANPEAQISSRKASQTAKLNYLLGSDPSKWASGLDQYQEITYHNIYPNIDLRYYLSTAGVCAFDFIVHPGGDPKHINWEIEGIEEHGLMDENLVLITSVGSAIYSAPKSFQAGEEVASSFQKISDGRYGFNIPQFDEKQDLVIDPILVFSTYSASTDDNFGFSATYAEDGSAYGAGIVYGYNVLHRAYPTTNGALQDSSQGGRVDIGISKYSADGSSQIYATYLGGINNELPFSLLEGPNKSLIVLGATGSQNFPMNPSGYDTSFTKGSSDLFTIGGTIAMPNSSDIFVCILDSTGGNLLGSTFFGDSASDGNNQALRYNYGDPARGDITLDNQGNIIISSYTYSDNLPTGSASDSQYRGNQDGLVVSFSSDLQQLNWASYIGGEDHDATISVRYTPQNRLYVTGITRSDSLSYDTTNVYQGSKLDLDDAFLAELNPNNGSIIKWTYTGTAANDRAFFIDYTPQGNLVVFGQTNGLWPSIGDSVWGVANSSMFLQEFSPDLSQVLRSTVFGDGDRSETDISPTALMVSDCGDIFISGWGASYTRFMGDAGGMPVTPNAYRDSSDFGDFYFMRLSSTWQKLEYATFFGQYGISADHVDGGSSRFRKDGSIFQAVCACSDLFPTSASAFADSNGSGNCNMLVFRFDMQADSIYSDVSVAPGYSDSTCLPAELKFSDFSFNADLTLVQLPDGSIDTLANQSFTVSDSGFSTFRFFALDTNCNLIDSNDVLVYGYNKPLSAAFSFDYDSCNGTGQVQFLNASAGASAFRWDFGDGNASSAMEPAHNYLPGNYTVRLVVTDTVCNFNDTLEQNLRISFRSGQTGLFTESDACDPERQLSAQADLSKIDEYDFQLFEWYIDDQLVGTGDSLNYNFRSGGYHDLKLRYIDTICGREIDEEQELFFYDEDFELNFPNIFTPNGDGLNDEFNMLNREELAPFLAQASIEIYNRKGVRVFAGDLLKESWDGTNEGTELSPAVYFYVFKYQDICGQVQDSKGFLHLQR